VQGRERGGRRVVVRVEVEVDVRDRGQGGGDRRQRRGEARNRAARVQGQDGRDARRADGDR